MYLKYAFIYANGNEVVKWRVTNSETENEEYVSLEVDLNKEYFSLHRARIQSMEKSCEGSLS